MLKKCCHCEEIKSLDEFHKNRSTKDGYQKSCKECRKSSHRTPEYKARQKARSQTPEAKTKRKAYRGKPENKAKYEARRKKRFDTNPMLKLNRAIRQAIRISLKGNKGGRHTWDLLGFTLQELRIHLESLWLPDMSWENYGQWHIDHIIPISSFNFTSPEDPEFQECWALSNLQPLWAIDNIRKGAKII